MSLGHLGQTWPAQTQSEHSQALSHALSVASVAAQQQQQALLAAFAGLHRGHAGIGFPTDAAQLQSHDLPMLLAALNASQSSAAAFPGSSAFPGWPGLAQLQAAQQLAFPSNAAQSPALQQLAHAPSVPQLHEGVMALPQAAAPSQAGQRQAAVETAMIEASPSPSHNPEHTRNADARSQQAAPATQHRRKRSTDDVSTADVSHGKPKAARSASDLAVSRKPCNSPAVTTAGTQQLRPDSGPVSAHSGGAVGGASTAMPPPPTRRTAVASAAATRRGPHDTQAHTLKLLGPQQWASVRSTLLKQQQTFVQQLFELHKLTQMQDLLCAELGVDPAMPCPPPPAAAAAGAPGDTALRSHGASVWRVMPLTAATLATQQTDTFAQADLTPQQRVRVDIARLINIPASLRAKALTGSPRVSMPVCSAAPTPPEGVELVKPKPVWAPSCVAQPHPGASQQSMSVGQPVSQPAAQLAAAGFALPGSMPPPAAVAQPPQPAQTPQPQQQQQAAAHDMMAAAAAAAAAALWPSLGAAGMGGMPQLPASLAATPAPPQNIVQAAAALMESSGSLPSLPQSLQNLPQNLPSLPQSLPGLPQGLPNLPLAYMSGAGAAGAAGASGSLPSIGGVGGLAIAGSLPGGSVSAEQGKASDGVTFKSAASAGQGGVGMAPTPALPPLPPGLMSFPVLDPSYLASLPMQAQLDPQAVDPHAAWMSRHFGAGRAAGSGAPTDAALAYGGLLAGAADGSGGLAAPGAIGGSGEPGRWWHDETATFGEVLPSSMPAGSLSGGAGQLGSKRAVTARAQNGAQRRSRKDVTASPAQEAGAFKAFKPKKTRSQRGSNRLGSFRTATANASSDSGLSNGSQNQQGGGSFFAGSAAGINAGVAGSTAAARRAAYAAAAAPPMDEMPVAPLDTNTTPAYPQMQLQYPGDQATAPVADAVDAAGLGAVGGGGADGGGGSTGGGSAGGDDKKAAGILLSLSAGVQPSGGSVGCTQRHGKARRRGGCLAVQMHLPRRTSSA